MNNEAINFIEDLYNKIEGGEENPLEIYLALSEIEKAAKAYKDASLEFALTEFDKYGKNSIEFKNYEVSKTAGATYEYKHDLKWQVLKADLDNYQLEMKNNGTAVKNYSKNSLSFKHKKI